MEANKRPRIGIVLDYSLRYPEFGVCYTKLKQTIMGDIEFGMTFDEETNAIPGFWNNLKNSDSKAYEFYVKMPTPEGPHQLDFDITWKKYFYNEDHRSRFLTEWSFNMFGQGNPNNKQDVQNVNLAQSQLFDIVLIDRCQHTRKITNTFSFLSRAGIFCKEIIFVGSDDEIEEITKDYLGVWNPYKNKDQIICQPKNTGQPTKNLLDWLMQLEANAKNDNS